MLNFLKKTYPYFNIQRFCKKLNLKLLVIKTLNSLKIIFIRLILQSLLKLNQLLHLSPSLRKWLLDLARKTKLYSKLQRLRKRINYELYLNKRPNSLKIIFIGLILQILLKLNQLLPSFPILRKWLVNVNHLQRSLLKPTSFIKQQEIKFISFENNAIDLEFMTPRSRQIYQDLKLAIQRQHRGEA